MYVIHSWEWDRHRDDIQDLGKSLSSRQNVHYKKRRNQDHKFNI